ncbi:hypothetical protein NM688_g1346 [Phlebia brevispora]|uniref:Uncharacterized protein n=1 Tax=Phlebia brevispora TaxID=194682 RepID=A0ACC1TCD8_9APHY|nr:hypothetical protein NM688_g1346 [Phlebia brevispora]
MSQAAYDPELVSAFQQQYVETIILNALTALVAYEYVITLGQEIVTMWRRKLNGATVLFFLNRYLMVLSVIMVYVPFTAKVQWYTAIHRGDILGSNRRICRYVYRLHQTSTMLNIGLGAAFSALRIYALWDRNILLLSVVFVLNLVPVGTNLVSYHHYHFCVERIANLLVRSTTLVYFLPNTMSIPSLANSVAYLSLTLIYTFSGVSLPVATRAALIVVDALVVILTWIKTYDAYKTASSLNFRVPLLTLFFRDGTMYFVAVLLMNVMHILLQSVSVMQSLTPATLFFTTLTPILISRFLLNLRQLDGAIGTSDETYPSSEISIPGFRIPPSLITGNLGQTLEHGESDVIFDLDASSTGGGGNAEDASSEKKHFSRSFI